MPLLRLLALALLLTACSGAPTAPNELVALGNVRNTATAEAAVAQATALPITESANERQFIQDQTATFRAPALTGTAQAQTLIDATLTAVWHDATAQANTRATQSVEFSVMRETAIPATGTALAVEALIQADDLQVSANNRNVNFLATTFGPLIVLAFLGLFGIWLTGIVVSDIKRRNKAAEAKPEVIGGALVLPPGYTKHPIILPAIPATVLPPPPEIQEREIPVNQNGKVAFITKSEPVNDHEKAWRMFLANVLIYARDHGGLGSKVLAGVGKPLSSNDNWMVATKYLAENNLILKDNGDTTLPAGEWGALIARVQDATHPLRLPERLPPRFRVLEPSETQ